MLYSTAKLGILLLLWSKDITRIWSQMVFEVIQHLKTGPFVNTFNERLGMLFDSYS